jgi:hypothetical protein
MILGGLGWGGAEWGNLGFSVFFWSFTNKFIFYERC